MLLRLASFLLLLLALAPPARAEVLTHVRPFTAPGHARLLLVLDGEARGGELTTRSSPPLGSIAARGVAWLGGVQAAPDLPAEVPVEADGVRRILAAQVGEGLQITVELDEARQVRAARIHPKAVVLDLVGEGAPADAALPTDAQLLAFAEGQTLTRTQLAGTDRTLVVLDAGHGGFDHGAVGVTGTREADIALQLVQRTARQVQARLGAEVLLTREEDIFVGLTQRARIANNAEADLFVSIHANAAMGPGAWGIETYSMDTASDSGAARVAARENAIAWEQGGSEGADQLAAKLITAGTMRLSKELAAHVQAEVCRRLATVYGDATVRDLGTKTALFTVLTRTRMPAILFESSFVSNPTDERKLRAPHFQEALATAITDAIGQYLDRQGSR